ncbi:PspA/IM30 family protein [Acinetobacter calcoaceticus]|uniref:PspA/IM30 family protein n=1 Tax=Acinetobacter calcoaceticus TaxID=471 RepID=UPI001E47C58A|nr:hypothetical protein [Acinetobacter calcoaceticus]UGQ30401.1 hypothetical protein LRO84_02845 [Acinetobacter calcoaceticus]
MGFLFENKRQVWMLVILIILIWLVFPFLFKAFMSWMSWIGADLKTFADYGPVGDIYGSLNTLFTSATLIIVMYSAYLQREANKDTRDAMAEQLQQARDATAKQLIQARQSTKQQLELAQQSHEAQLAESKYAVFSSMFNILLNEKNKSLERLSENLGDHTTNDLFGLLSDYFLEKISTDWKEHQTVKDKNDKFLFNEFNIFIESIYDRENVSIALNSYLYLYISLINLIKKSDLTSTDKGFFYYFLSNSMTYDEQVTLLWFCPCSIGVRNALRDTGLIDNGFYEDSHYFIFRNFDKSIFRDADLLKRWEKS